MCSTCWFFWILFDRFCLTWSLMCPSKTIWWLILTMFVMTSIIYFLLFRVHETRNHKFCSLFVYVRIWWFSWILLMDSIWHEIWCANWKWLDDQYSPYSPRIILFILEFWGHKIWIHEFDCILCILVHANFPKFGWRISFGLKFDMLTRNGLVINSTHHVRYD